uniref:Uncharacterized protein n=1 Tax=viral metagenome TaxID=1070528 RepID=A0A6C0K1P5_9ZZZZ
MNLVDAFFNKIPNIFWVNTAKTLMQEICDSIINDMDDPDPKKQRHAKIQILNVFIKFLNENFSVANTAVLSDRFKDDFLRGVMNTIKHPMESFLENDYINLLVLKKILDTDDKLSKNGKIFLNVLQYAIIEVQRKFGKDTPINKARKVIQLIKEQLKPLTVVSEPNSPIPMQSGGNSDILREIDDAIQLLTEMRPAMNEEQFNKINEKLQGVRKYAITNKSEIVNPDSNGIPNIIQGPIQGTSAALNNVVQGTSAALNNAVPDSSAALNNVVQGTSAALNNVVQGTSAALNNAVPDSSAALNNVVQGTSAALNNVVQGTSAALNNAVPDSSAALNNAVQGQATALNNVVQGTSAALNNVVQGPTAMLSGLTNTLTHQVSSMQDETNRKIQETQAKALSEASAHGEKLLRESLGKATGEISEKGEELLKKVLGNIEKGPEVYNSAAEEFEKIKKKYSLPTISSLSSKIIEEVFKNFSKTDKKGYSEIREDIYEKFLGALNDHLRGPEGRQMFLRTIDPFLTNCIDNVIDSGAVAIVSIIHLVSKVSTIREIVESSLVVGFEQIVNNTMVDEFGNLDPLEDTLFVEFVIYRNILPKMTKLLETKNPLNQLYANMNTMEYDETVIKEKQNKDYKKTLCSSYAYMGNEPVVGVVQPPSTISSVPTSETIFEGETQQAIQNSLNMPGAYFIPGINTPQSSPVASAQSSESILENDTEQAINASLQNLPEAVEVKPEEPPVNPPGYKNGGTRSNTIKKQVRLQNKQTRYSR